MGNKSKMIHTLDIGGSGVKSAIFSKSKDGTLNLEKPVSYLQNPEWGSIEDWLYDHIGGGWASLSISCGGFMDYTNGAVKLFRIANWHDKPLMQNLQERFPDTRMFLLNDGEAHLYAHHDLYDHPQMCLALGTSLAFAITNNSGKFIRAGQNTNFDIGEVKLKTNAHDPHVWWALGSHGLKHLQDKFGDKEGTRHFGYRLGSFLKDFASIFQPATIILSGGITESCWPVFQENLFSEFSQSKPDWLKMPSIVQSPYGREAALRGMAKWADTHHC